MTDSDRGARTPEFTHTHRHIRINIHMLVDVVFRFTTQQVSPAYCTGEGERTREFGFYKQLLDSRDTGNLTSRGRNQWVELKKQR